MIKFGFWLESKDYQEAVAISPELVTRAQQRDEAVSNEFYTKTTEMLRRFLSSKKGEWGINDHDVDEISQEALSKIWEKLSTLDDVAAFSAFAIRIASNIGANWNRSRKQMRRHLGGGKDMQSVDSSQKGAALFQADPKALAADVAAIEKEQGSEKSARLQQIMAGLSDEDQEMLHDFYGTKSEDGEGMRYIDLCGKYKTKDGKPMPLGTIKRRLNQIRDKIRIAFGGAMEGTHDDLEIDLMLRMYLPMLKTLTKQQS